MSIPQRSRPPAATAEEEAYRFLLDGICQGRYATGQRLVTEDIAAALSMSRMPVREALRRLDGEGLVTVRPNRGAVVSGLSIDEMREVFDMRSALEGLAIRIATPRCTEQQLQTLERLLDEMDAYDAEPGEWITRHYAFHEYLCGLSGRLRLQRQICGLYSLIEAPMRLWMQQVTIKRRSAREAHQVLIDAMRARDADRAEHVLREHIEHTVPVLASFLEKTQSN